MTLAFRFVYIVSKLLDGLPRVRLSD